MMVGIVNPTGARAPGVGGSSHRVAVQYIASTDPTLGGSMLKHEGRRQTGCRSVYAGSRLKLHDVPGRSRLTRQPSSRNGENPPCGMIGGRWKRRHHSKSATRHRPTRRAASLVVVPVGESPASRGVQPLL